MINPNELVRRPVRERDLLPIATDEQVVEYLQRQIEDIRREVKSPIRALHLRHSRHLLRISGGEEYSLIGGDFDSRSGKLLPQQRVERGHAQDLLLKSMEAYGFDQEKSKPHLIYQSSLNLQVCEKSVTIL